MPIVKITFVYALFTLLSCIGIQRETSELASIEVTEVMAGNTTLSTTFLKSIVYPETLRYNELQNLIETSSLELAYLNYGSSVCDFSIGQMQMKPSFIEQLEREISQSQHLYITFSHLLPISKDLKAQRRFRLDNLKSQQFQEQYLQAFAAAVENKYEQQFTSEISQLSFYASCYNLGLNSTVQEINIWKDVAAFPYGKNNPKSKPYAQIATTYFLTQ